MHYIIFTLYSHGKALAWAQQQKTEVLGEKNHCKKGQAKRDYLNVKTRQTNWWHHLPAISHSEQGIGLGGGGVPYWRGLVGVHMPHWMQTSTIVCLFV